VLRRVIYTDAGATSLAVVADLPTLEALDLEGTPVSAQNIEEIAMGARLQNIGLANTGVDDLSPLAILTDMEDLDVSGNPLQSVAFAASWERLDTLDLRDSAVQTLDGLELLEVLNSVDARGSQLRDVQGLANNETFRNNDRLRATETALDTDDCTDVLVIRSRDGVIDVDFECP
jgi:Leucine-rich repeat (LRR) protein